MEGGKMKARVAIFGSGSIGSAIAEYLLKDRAVSEIVLFGQDKKDLGKVLRQLSSKKVRAVVCDITKAKTSLLAPYDIVFNALPGSVALAGAELALAAQKNLIDVSDLDFAEYKHLKKKAVNGGVIFVPECGVSPGLTNLIVGAESERLGKLSRIEIRAGTLSPSHPFVFPVTWNPEDLIAGHLAPALAIVSGRKRAFQPFSRYQREFVKGVGEFETYVEEGLSTLPQTVSAPNMTYRVIRPIGFMHFFLFLKNHGMLDDFATAGPQGIDNLTLIIVDVSGRKGTASWIVQSRSSKGETLNSMQKLTALLPVAVLQMILSGKIQKTGMVLTEELGREGALPFVLKVLRAHGLSVRRH
ncbi:MAG: saccharopine dehydrogenase NADP-binding domain-containing protein [bacterium]|nr:saccharopine dehydrogenase NADP-binding domain-containing protein [bacterium]